MAKRTNASVIGISESKRDSTVLDSKIYIENYEILRFDRNRHGGGVACYIRNLDILMPHTKPITIDIIYRPPNQSKLFDIFEGNLPKLN